MMKRTFLFTISVLGAGLLAVPQGWACDAGIAAFGETTHSLLQDNCVTCHTNAGPGPGFAVTDAEESYFRTRNYVDFTDIASSYLVERAGNGHCGCDMDEERMTASLQAWWGQGEEQCPATSPLQTTAISVPENLPTRDEGFIALEWPLDAIGMEFVGSKFSVEIQKFVEPTPTTPGAYRLRNPRISYSEHTFHVRGLRIYINRRTDPLANAFEFIDAVVSPQPHDLPNPNLPPPPHALLSADTVIIVQQRFVGDTISIGFDELAITEPETCLDVPMFSEVVAPSLEARNCYACHGGGPQQLAGDYPANHRFTMDASVEELCSAFLQRMNRSEPMNSVALKYPRGGDMAHPQIFTAVDIPYVGQLWNEWLASEWEARR